MDALYLNQRMVKIGVLDGSIVIHQYKIMNGAVEDYASIEIDISQVRGVIESLYSILEDFE